MRKAKPRTLLLSIFKNKFTFLTEMLRLDIFLTKCANEKLRRIDLLISQPNRFPLSELETKRNF